MSRFDATRRVRVLAWAGAALAWGTAATMAGLEPPNEPADASPVEPTVTVPASSAQQAEMPNSPAGGLVVLRFQPSARSQQQAGPTPTPRAAAQPSPQPAPAPPPAPEPQSSGS